MQNQADDSRLARDYCLMANPNKAALIRDCSWTILYWPIPSHRFRVIFCVMNRSSLRSSSSIRASSRRSLRK